MKIKFAPLGFTFLLLFSLVNSRLYAQQKRPPLDNGMLHGEVVALWGSPRERVQAELKGTDTWIFEGGAEVIFKNGKVETWKDPRRIAIEQANLESPLEKSKTASNNGTSKNNSLHEDPKVVEEILSEIMSDPSTGTEPSSGASAPKIQPGIPNPIEPPDIDDSME
jgi:hypothetical protein